MTFDYVIVGGGTAGVVAAYRLAERGAGTVAIIEAGPGDNNRSDVLTLRNWPNLLEGELDYDFGIEPQPSGNSRLRHSQARVLGGCSSHNSCIAFRPPDFDFRRWTGQGIEGWTPTDVAPYFERVLSRVNLEESDSGNSCGVAFLDACGEAGIPRVSFEGGRYKQGAGWFALNKSGSIRHSASVAYLHSVPALPGELSIFTEVHVSVIRFDGKRAVSLETSAGAIEINEDLILCGGSFKTPQLLLCSGVGPADHLEELGIQVIADLPGIGENLLDHPEGVVIWDAGKKVPEESAQLYEIGLFVKTEPSEDIADVMFHFGTEAFDMHTAPSGYPTTDNGLCVTPNVMRPRSSGTVQLHSRNSGNPPRIDPKYFSDPEGYDMGRMIKGIRYAREIARQPALKSWIKDELAPGRMVQTDEEIAEYIRQTHNTVYHASGTCKIGSDNDPMAVVNSKLELRHFENVRIASAAVFPTLTSVNPALTCMMIGERCAAFVLRDEPAQ